MLNRLQWEEYGEGEHASLKEAQEEVIRLQNVYLRYKHTSISRNNLAGAKSLGAIMGRWQSAGARAGLMCWKKAWNLDRLLHQKLSRAQKLKPNLHRNRFLQRRKLLHVALKTF